MKQYIINDYKKSKMIVISLWIVYACAYFGRTCYGASIVSIISSGAFSKSKIGLVGTSFFICYGVGQIFSGTIGDKVNPFKMILTGCISSGVCCFLMAFTNENLVLMIIFWGLNGVFQSMLWAPVLRIFSETINKKLREKAVLRISLSLPVGCVFAYLVSTLLIKNFNWQYVFICGGLVIAVSFLIMLITFLKCKSDITIQNTIPELKQLNKNAKNNSLKYIILSSGLLVIFVPSFLHGMLRDGITNWVPTIMNEEYGIVPSFSIFLTLILPIINAFGAFAVTPLYKKFKRNEIRTVAYCALFFSCSDVAFTFYWENADIYCNNTPCGY